MTTQEELIVTVCGPVDAGKSSLIGVLTKGDLDNGRGDARSKVLKHNHEQSSGRTSSITLNPIKYKTRDHKISLNTTKSRKNQNPIKLKDFDFDGNHICNDQDKIVSLVDLAGHEKYLKTTIFGVTGLFPDRGILVIGANTGITKLTREHLGILLYLKIPIIITITKIDLAPERIYKDLCSKLKRLLTRTFFGKIVYFISGSENNNTETNLYIDKMINNPEIIPVISISNKVGTNIDNLHKILYHSPKRDKWNEHRKKHTMIYIDTTFYVPGIGLIVSGTLRDGIVKVKDKMFIGPENGEFKQVIVRSIHNSIREDVTEIGPDVQCCLAIKCVNQKDTLTRSMIRKGMIMIDSIDKWKDNIVKTFKARITILHHSTTIKTGYEPIIHCGPIRQPAKLKLLGEKERLKSKDSEIVEFTFKKHPEFIEENMTLFFRDGNTKGVGEVISV